MAAEQPAELLPNRLKPSELMVRRFLDGSKNAVSSVVEYCQKKGLTVRFTKRKLGGRNSEKPITYQCWCVICKKKYPAGEGNTDKAAKHDAASKAFRAIMGESYSEPEPVDRVLRSKGKSRSQTASSVSYLENPYPVFMLDSAKTELKNLIDLKGGISWDQLKMKCGITSSGIQDRRRISWGEASDRFVSSGLPPEDLHETVDSFTGFSDAANAANKTEIKNLLVSGSKQAAATTTDDDNGDGKDHNYDSDTDDYELSDLYNTASLHAPGPSAGATHSLRTVGSENLVETEMESSDLNNTVNLDAAEHNPDGSHALRTVSNENLNKTETELYELKNTDSLKEAGSIHGSDTQRTEGNEKLIETKSIKRKQDILEDDGGNDNREVGVGITVNRNSLSTVECNENHSLTNKKAKKSESKITARLLKQANKIKEKGNKNHGKLTGDSVELTDTEICVQDSEPLDSETGNEIFLIDLDRGDTSSLSETVAESGKEVLKHMTDSELKFESLKNKYKCDLCLAVSVSSERMFQHLREALHYSASLVSVDEKGIPENIIQQYALINRAAAYKTLIPVCPEPSCPLVFLHIYACATHYNVCHKQDEGAVYAVAELLQEDTIESKYLLGVCKVCSEEFPTRELLAKHIKNETHLPYTEEDNTQTMFMCSGCKLTFFNFYKLLTNHGHKKKKRHISAVKVLHISLNRIKRSILPYKRSSAAQLTCIKSEIHNLKKLKKQAGKQAKRQMILKIEELHKIRFDSGNQTGRRQKMYYKAKKPCRRSERILQRVSQ